ncbi:sensor histidine kinase [Pseudobacteroides cellulosolvens]|uniref:histidine kinase n=1 Tax=Pseudobacteroides cellulosolvens ATCC 35603 = DSM 2933 TaxID=398512 RepID=A0A0L6JQL2_9FIRM|nr:ATP-binding protein [Pseudobacteroides cellulosolvens]KNY28079.1 integral membrane sensor signal transduction histidine kinase [Pseudobacteroides cellulosolvens ATCC 35603 = DSM 2933]
MKYSLRVKLSFSYALVALISVVLIMAITNLFLDKYFREYVRHNQEQKNNDVISSISHQYQDNGKWNMEMIETIGVRALENGLIIKVKDKDGNAIWDATVHNNGMCQRIIEHMAQNVSSRYPHMKGTYTEIPYAINSGFAKVGEIQIGSYGPYYLSDNDLAFINTLNKLLIGIGIFTMLFSLVLGSIIARRLSSPISRVIRSAQSIAKGYFSDRVLERSNTKEICQLTSTINNLAGTLEKQEVLRKRIGADVAHELRTPLATLQSHMEAMIDGIWKPDAERLKSCHEEIIRINKMVGDLEKLARYESESLVLNKTSFDISELIYRIVLNFEPEFKNKDIKLAFNGESEEVFADKDKISQVVINLVSNALKYTPEGGVVNISVKGAEDITEISVKDNGPGIPEEDLPFIFERFYRADKSRNRLTGGSGIGLTIVKAITEAHKGRIEVQSRVDYGTEFILSLPKETNQDE